MIDCYSDLVFDHALKKKETFDNTNRFNISFNYAYRYVYIV